MSMGCFVGVVEGVVIAVKGWLKCVGICIC